MAVLLPTPSAVIAVDRRAFAFSNQNECNFHNVSKNGGLGIYSARATAAAAGEQHIESYCHTRWPSINFNYYIDSVALIDIHFIRMLFYISTFCCWVMHTRRAKERERENVRFEYGVNVGEHRSCLARAEHWITITYTLFFQRFFSFSPSPSRYLGIIRWSERRANATQRQMTTVKKMP